MWYTPGVPIDPNFERTIQLRIKELLGCRFDGFAGAQPVSFAASHFHLLETEDYFVCEKSDGIRYLMFATNTPKGPATFFVDRKNKVQYIADLKLPLRDTPNKYHHETMMDGELVVDLDRDKKSVRFLVFDLMVINGAVVTQRSLSTRLGMFRQDVIDPLRTALKNDPELAKRQPFTYVIEMERSYGLPKIFLQLPHLKHANDGLIFTPVKLPYSSGTCPKLLKWKPANSNTVDFKINVVWNTERKPRYELLIACNGVHKRYDQLTLEEELAAKWRRDPPNNRIGEFWWDPNWKTTIANDDGYAPVVRAGGWRFQRFRDDKELANDEKVLKKIWNSIQDAVSQEMLEGHCDIIRRGWKEREKPPLPPPLQTSTTPKNPPTTSTTTKTASRDVLQSPASHHSTTSFQELSPTSVQAPTLYRNDNAATSSSSRTRPVPQKRQSKAMLEFILNDSPDPETKRARYE
ncbi:6470_t:CDS:10 [Ambispora gerdemannii]|uniref:mRNA guanylyltransferase n=1 Tax=Ambispora gerdemannii TaxID=144530 RepID=A0A9N9AAC8_9GLOM|nr:6470_t:CDS:10 [Ambispora gerdemannii]